MIQRGDLFAGLGFPELNSVVVRSGSKDFAIGAKKDFAIGAKSVSIQDCVFMFEDGDLLAGLDLPELNSIIVMTTHSSDDFAIGAKADVPDWVLIPIFGDSDLLTGLGLPEPYVFG